MEKVQPQRTELYEYLNTYMEQLFQDSCSAVQTILDTDSAKIWEHFQDAVRECLEKTKSLQQQNQKGILHYLMFSPMQYAPFLDRLELRIDALDDGFYLDTQEASAHYHADFYRTDFKKIWHFYMRRRLKNLSGYSTLSRSRSDRITQCITILCCFR